MKIINSTKKTMLSDDALEATSFFDKSFGLIDPNKPRSLILNTHLGIHTIGMKEAIDVLILDHRNSVVSFKINLQPNRIFFWNPKFDLVIELPNGMIHSSQTEFGDIIEILHDT